MKRGLKFFRGRLLPLTISVIAGAVIGVAIAGMPDSSALTGGGGSPDLTVKPGALIDPSDLTVPSLLTIPGPVPPAPADPNQNAPTTLPGDGLRNRTDVIIVVSNANGGTGLARTWADRAVALGYADPDLSTAPTATDTIVYFAEGFEGEAQRLAGEFASTPIAVRPLADAPVTTPAFAGNVLIVIGRNVPNLAS